MKHFILCLILSVGFGNTISSQCDLRVNEFDKFDRIPRVETRFETIHHKFMQGRVQVAIGNVGFYEDYLLIRLFIQNYRWSISNRHKISFLFDDDSVMQLIPDASVNSSNVYESKIGTASGSAEVGIIGLPLTEQDLNKFYEHEVTQIRIQLREGIREYDIKKKNREKIKFQIGCADRAIDDLDKRMKSKGINYSPSETLAIQEKESKIGYTKKTINEDGSVKYENPSVKVQSHNGKKSNPIGDPTSENTKEEVIDQETKIEVPEHKKSTIDFESISKEDTPPVPQAPPPPPPTPEIEEIFKVVEQMPRFPGCENEIGDNRDKESCAKEKMLQFIYQNLTYPQEARDAKLEGMCVVQFVVNTKGAVTEIKTVRDIGQGCGKAASEVVHLMNQMDERWTPGMQRGKTVKVLYTLPVRFKLEG